MRISRKAAIFLMAFGVYSWIIWPTFLKNIWQDDRSWNHGATAFFLVHLVLTVVSLTLGTIVAAIGIRAVRRPVDPNGGTGSDSEDSPDRGVGPDSGSGTNQSRGLVESDRVFRG